MPGIAYLKKGVPRDEYKSNVAERRLPGYQASHAKPFFVFEVDRKGKVSDIISGHFLYSCYCIESGG